MGILKTFTVECRHPLN